MSSITKLKIDDTEYPVQDENAEENITKLQETVGDSTKGLVKDVAANTSDISELKEDLINYAYRVLYNPPYSVGGVNPSGSESTTNYYGRTEYIAVSANDSIAIYNSYGNPLYATIIEFNENHGVITANDEYTIASKETYDFAITDENTKYIRITLRYFQNPASSYLDNWQKITSVYHRDKESDSCGNNILVDRVFYEKPIYANENVYGSQGIACDGKYLYCFNGVTSGGEIVKINLSNGAATVSTAPTSAEHANSATYNPSNGHLYIVADETKIIEMTTDFTVVSTYSVTDLSAIAWSEVGFYGFKADGSVVKFSDSFSTETTIVSSAVPSDYIMQGMECDGVNLYVCALNTSYQGCIYIYKMDGNFVGRRTVLYGINKEFEECVINYSTGDVYLSYQDPNDSYRMFIVKAEPESDWFNLYDLISSIASNTTISKYTQPLMMRIRNNVLQLRGHLYSKDSGNIFRLPNCICPKESYPFIIDGQVLHLGTTSAGFGNYTFPFNKSTSDELNCNLDGLCIAVNPLIT